MTTATTPELKIEPKLPVLAFNFDQLKAWATALAERYASIVVTEDAIADVKRDMAELNKAKKAVDDARKEAVRRVSEPIRAFETQIKEVCGIFDDAYGKLSGQVKAYEDAQREAKRKDIEGLIIEANMNAFGEPAFLDIPVQDKWLNKTTSVKAIREDIAAIIDRHMEEEQRKRALEQARQDRAAAIESHVKALNQQYGYDLPVAVFMGASFLDVNTPLADVLKRVAHYFQLEKEKLEQQAKKAAAASRPVATPQPATSAPTDVTPPAQSASVENPAPAETRAMSIVLEYDVANEAAVKACLENLKTLCVNFGARYR